MRMVPRCPEEGGLKAIRERRAGCDRTLLDGSSPVKVRCALLQEAMLVERSTLGRPIDLVVHGDDDRIAPIGLNQRAGELAVDEDDAAVDAIWSNVATSDGEVVAAGPSTKDWRGILIWISVADISASPREGKRWWRMRRERP